MIWSNALDSRPTWTAEPHLIEIHEWPGMEFQKCEDIEKYTQHNYLASHNTATYSVSLPAHIFQGTSRHQSKDVHRISWEKKWYLPTYHRNVPCQLSRIGKWAALAKSKYSTSLLTYKKGKNPYLQLSDPDTIKTPFSLFNIVEKCKFCSRLG